MKKVGIKLLALAMAGAVTGTTVFPSYPTVSVYAQEQTQQAIKWSFFRDDGVAGEETDTGIKLSGDGDSFGITDIQKPDNYSVKATLTQGSETGAVGVVLGARDAKKPKEGSIVANVTPDSGEVRVFEFTSSGVNEIGNKHIETNLKEKDQYTFEITVKSGKANVKINDTMAFENVNLSDKANGNIGFISFNETMTVSNIDIQDIASETTPDDTEKQNFETNLNNLNLGMSSGEWKKTKEGLYSNAIGRGDCFALSETKAANFVYSTDVTFKKNEGAAALVFRANSNSKNEESYAVNLDASSHKCKFWRWQKDGVYNLIDEKEIKATNNETYTLKVVACDAWISYYVNDVLVASTGDYTLQKDDKGQSTVLTEGYLGLLNWNGEMTFQNTYYTELKDTKTPILNKISVKSSTGEVEKATQFVSTEPITIQYVKNNAETVNLDIEKADPNAEVVVKDADGKEYKDGQNIPVKVGKNYITVTSTVQGENNQSAALTYRVNVHRRDKDEIYYNEPYRGQYHYSVKDGWANDPNGLVKYKGTYHMFYQFYDDTKWGPMHWAHATSTDLLHWDEQPIALYPDANGAMFSGCIVADENNDSGFFENGKGGLVALITADGNGQRIKLAYSTDEGQTWTKSNEIAADWKDDELKNRDFRDPKVFRWEGKWFMVVAGGPLRIYSSENLKTWKCESAYADLHTECPDLYPIKTDEGIKWVLSRGGRYYKVGDFKEVEGKWKFVADKDYENKDGVMNFGRDSYAAMTYYEKDFGTSQSPDIPEIVELNWMNTWDDYCNLVADKVGQNFNGTFNLNLKLGLAKEDGKYVLTQTPISAYKELRDEDNKITINQSISENNEVLKDFANDTYEIVAKFTPSEGTKKVGFRLRSNQKGTEYTDVIYDIEKGKLSIDRSKSGVNISGKFAEINSQEVTKNEDGTIDLHVYVDKSSVEVFTKGDTVTGANQIFPTPTSLGASVIVEGDPVEADMTIYPMKSIWKDKKPVTKPQSVGSMQSADQSMYVGDALTLSAYVLPISVDQGVNWNITSGKDIVNLKEEDGNAVLQALKTGEAVITATSKADSSKSKTFTVKVKKNNFKTNIKQFVNVNGDWDIDDEVLADSNTSSNDFYMSADKVVKEKSTMETDMSFAKGLINLFFASAQTDPFAQDGAYAIQFAPDSKEVRLFRFGKDTIATGQMSASISDDQYHHIKIEKTSDSVIVYVDNEKCLTHKFDKVEDFYNQGYAGVGLWDGAVNFKNFYVDKQNTTEPEDPVKPVDPIEKPKAVTVTLKGKGGKVVATIKNAKAGTKLPAWSKTKFKAAGKKGYVFAGWTYNGKVVTKMPSVNKNITLTAKFTKLSVGKAKVLKVKGKSGKGIGFAAVSEKYTKKDGSRRGFRFRYSTRKSMKNAKYKTTGLAKNTYTKTGLKKGKKYYVQVRYYYYDSTNQKVYGAYSKVKTVKAY